MQYYSAIKKNVSESVLMKWMNLEPIIHSEVKSEREKQTSYVNTHTMESRKMVLMKLCTGPLWRRRHRDQTYGHGERGKERVG